VNDNKMIMMMMMVTSKIYIVLIKELNRYEPTVCVGHETTT